ncbi:MAG: 1-deoxy-D-xylulose-5-phosphate synthase, partial [Deltaproteobacteria bacterium]|nr:1-deoxy-D-xylulose-5-phosphate synthase [Deltaproteobacteria bacterium]
VVFAIDRGGIVGEDGATHHGLFDLSFLRSLPNMTVMAPKDDNELRRMLITAFSHNGPIAIRYPRGKVTVSKIKDNHALIPIGKGEILTNGNDILILCIGRTVSEALYAQSELSKTGISATIVNCRFVKPLDTDLIISLAGKIKKIITVEENVLHGGFGSAILECLNDNKVTAFSLKRIGIADTFVEHGSQNLLRAKYGIDSQAIVNTAKELIDR